MKTNSMVAINGNKLQNAIESRGMTMSYASEQLGYNRMFFTNCKCRGAMNRSAIISLQNRFGIPLDDYKIEEKPEIIKAIEEPVKEVVEQKVEQIDYERLWKVIYTASFEAFKKALEEGRE